MPSSIQHGNIIKESCWHVTSMPVMNSRTDHPFHAKKASNPWYMSLLVSARFCYTLQNVEELVLSRVQPYSPGVPAPIPSACYFASHMDICDPWSHHIASWSIFSFSGSAFLNGSCTRFVDPVVPNKKEWWWTRMLDACWLHTLLAWGLFQGLLGHFQLPFTGQDVYSYSINAETNCTQIRPRLVGEIFLETVL